MKTPKSSHWVKTPFVLTPFRIKILCVARNPVRRQSHDSDKWKMIFFGHRDWIELLFFVGCIVRAWSPEKAFFVSNSWFTQKRLSLDTQLFPHYSRCPQGRNKKPFTRSDAINLPYVDAPSLNFLIACCLLCSKKTAKINHSCEDTDKHPGKQHSSSLVSFCVSLPLLVPVYTQHRKHIQDTHRRGGRREERQTDRHRETDNSFQLSLFVELSGQTTMPSRRGTKMCPTWWFWF